MDDVYKLEQYHCHWGCSDSRGSEHTVDGQAFAGEVIIQILAHMWLTLNSFMLTSIAPRASETFLHFCPSGHMDEETLARVFDQSCDSMKRLPGSADCTFTIFLSRLEFVDICGDF